MKGCYYHPPYDPSPCPTPVRCWVRAQPVACALVAAEACDTERGEVMTLLFLLCIVVWCGFMAAAEGGQ